ncbi:MAG: hypothetical protein Ct9H300mP13_3760 [Gammaproteobacteria bacterium]|nr:MAG: hypothetical protein Ct9H300mP13_3760 [Gammaproteobacteria bacterium]
MDETAKLSIVLIRLLIDFGHPRLPDSGQSFFRLTLIIPRDFLNMAKESVTVNIMDRQFTVGCKKQEREDLLNAAAYLDDQLRSVQAQSKVVGLEHCVVIAALNLTNELLKLRRHPQAPEALSERIRSLRERVSNVVSETPIVS